jgi:hypothetical protein
MTDRRHTGPMRLLLVLALLLASLGFGPPASAQAHHEAAAQHRSPAAHDEHRRSDDGDRTHDEIQPVAHGCTGCAFLVEPALADAAAAPALLPSLPSDPVSLQAFHANPIPPPPRMT